MIPLINETYKAMLTGKSVIRELNEYANDIKQHPHLKMEDIFDYSLGNPSVPVPEAFNARIHELLSSGNPMLVHGYSPSLGIPSVRDKIAASLNRRFGMRYTMDDIFMTSGAAGALAHAFRLVTKPGDEILTFAPFFPEYRPYTAGAGLTLRVVPGKYGELPDQLRRVRADVDPRRSGRAHQLAEQPLRCSLFRRNPPADGRHASPKGKGIWP